MRPLRSPILEYRIEGTLQLLGGIAIGVVAASTHRPVPVTLGWLVGAVIFGGVMYVLVYRRYIADAVRDARAAPADAAYESGGMTGRRVATRALATLLPLLVLAVLLRNPTVVAAILSGNGAMFLVLSRWMEHWQRQQGVQVLREPRYRWRRENKRRGRGVMDAQDFYLAPL
jgi:TRAP-type mannitol/chloroaromatic compound transport system permease large subunit